MILGTGEDLRLKLRRYEACLSLSPFMLECDGDCLTEGDGADSLVSGWWPLGRVLVDFVSNSRLFLPAKLANDKGTDAWNVFLRDCFLEEASDGAVEVGAGWDTNPR